MASDRAIAWTCMSRSTIGGKTMACALSSSTSQVGSSRYSAQLFPSSCQLSSSEKASQRGLSGVPSWGSLLHGHAPTDSVPAQLEALQKLGIHSHVQWEYGQWEYGALPGMWSAFWHVTSRAAEGPASAALTRAIGRVQPQFWQAMVTAKRIASFCQALTCSIAINWWLIPKRWGR